mgnify:CR=1 FL=1
MNPLGNETLTVLLEDLRSDIKDVKMQVDKIDRDVARLSQADAWLKKYIVDEKEKLWKEILKDEKKSITSFIDKKNLKLIIWITLSFISGILLKDPELFKVVVQKLVQVL